MLVDEAYLDGFKADLLTLDPPEIFSRYIAPDRCRGLVDVDQEALRRRIAANFSVPVTSVLIVGSAKLGFTLTYKKATDEGEADRPPLSPFSENSDVDVAIVSDELFDSIWKKCFEFWHSSGYTFEYGYWPQGRYFRDYIFRGWMRPDHLPSEGSFLYKNQWFDFFRTITSERAAGDFKVTAALYREVYFLKAYHEISIRRCRNYVQGGIG